MKTERDMRKHFQLGDRLKVELLKDLTCTVIRVTKNTLKIAVKDAGTVTFTKVTDWDAFLKSIEVL